MWRSEWSTKSPGRPAASRARSQLPRRLVIGLLGTRPGKTCSLWPVRRCCRRSNCTSPSATGGCDADGRFFDRRTVSRLRSKSTSSHRALGDLVAPRARQQQARRMGAGGVPVGFKVKRPDQRLGPDPRSGTARDCLRAEPRGTSPGCCRSTAPARSPCYRPCAGTPCDG